MLRFVGEVIFVAIFIQMIVALEKNDTEIPFHPNASEEKFLKCADDTQLKIINDAIVTASVSEIGNGNMEYTWDIFTKMRVTYDELINKIVNRFLLDTCSNDCVHTILKFVNYSSNANWKLIGYRAVLHEISTNGHLRNVPTNWWFLQLFLSSEKLIPMDSEFDDLLGEVKPKIIELLDGKPSSEIEPQIVVASNYYDSKVYNGFLIEQLASMDPSYVQKIWNNLNLDWKPLETILQFVTALEDNNLFNYTVLAIPQIKNQLNTRYMDQQECMTRNQLLKQIVAKFPKESILKMLLVNRQQFYIRHADTQEYLCRLTNFKTLIIMCSTRNSTWLVESNSRDYRHLNNFVIKTEFESVMTVTKCPLQNEWFFEWNGFGSSFQDTDHWDFEVNDIFSNKIQIRNKHTGQYMRVNDSHGVSLSHLNKDEPQKFEWILEASSNVDIRYFDCANTRMY